MATVNTTKTTSSSGTSALTDPNRLAQKLKSTPEALQDFQDLADSPDYQQGVAPETKQSLQDAINQAKDLYNQHTTNNDWADVAQTMAQAIAQFGAAQAGMSNAGRFGNPMSGLSVPKVDYNARNDRELGALKNSTQQAQDLASATRNDFQDQEKAKQESFSRQAEPLKEGVRAATSRDQEAVRLGQMNRVENRQEERSSRQDARLELGENNKELNDLSKRLKAGETLANQLNNEDSVSKKDLDKLQLKYGSLAGQAGVNLSDTVNQYEQNAPRKTGSGPVSWVKEQLGVKEPVDKPAAYSNLMDSMGLSDLKKRVEELRARNKQLVSGGGSNSQVQQPAVTPETPGSSGGASAEAVPSTDQPQTIKVQGPSGTVAEMTPEAAKKYLGKPGYTQVK